MTLCGPIDQQERYIFSLTLTLLDPPLLIPTHLFCIRLFIETTLVRILSNPIQLVHIE